MPALARAAIGDSLLNVVTGIGTAKDPRTSTRYHLRLLEKNVLEHMYRGDWMARRLVDLPAHDATREWRTWQMSSKSAQAVKDLENRFFIRRKVYQALVRSRLYGGGALVIGVDQGAAVIISSANCDDGIQCSGGGLRPRPWVATLSVMRWLSMSDTFRFATSETRRPAP
jgi:hypothetical protein